MNHCGQCRHWHKKPRQGVPDLSQPESGDCRCLPPNATVQAVRSGTRVLQTITSVYPDLPATFPACGCYEEVTRGPAREAN